MTSIPCPNCDALIEDAFIDAKFAGVGCTDEVAIKVECIECGHNWSGSLRMSAMSHKTDDLTIKL